MKYRPLASTGAAVSSLCLSIGPEQFAQGPAALKALIIASLEAGINAYHFEVATPALLQAAGEALSHVERPLLWISLALGGPKTASSSPPRSFSPTDLAGAVEAGLHASGLGWFDVAALNEPAEDELPLSALTTLKALRSSGQVRMIGIKGEAPVMDTYISTGAFDALFTACSVNTEGVVRSRMRAAQKRDMAIFIYDYDRDVRPQPRSSSAALGRKKGILSLLGLSKPQAVQPDSNVFDFLHTTPGWAAPELCLGLALTDPAISSALISVTSSDEIETLAKVVERHLPSRLAAQIEMARVG